MSGAFSASISSPATSNGVPTAKDPNLLYIERWILELWDPNLRENAISELSKIVGKDSKRDGYNALAPLLWNSFGTIAVLIQEVISLYPFLSPPTLTTDQSTRGSNAAALLQCVAAHPDTRMPFIEANIPLYVYPFLKTDSNHKTFEFLRLSSLGVIGALVKVADTKIIHFLLSNEIIPLCLKTMEMGKELSRTVATFIVLNILMDDLGLGYTCTKADHFNELCGALGSMVCSPTEPPTSRLLKLIIRCYLRLSDNPKACDALNSCLPDKLRNGTFSNFYNEDPTMSMCMQQLLHNIRGKQTGRQRGGGF